MEMNVDKLERYPGGEFDVHYSENRKEETYDDHKNQKKVSRTT